MQFDLKERRRPVAGTILRRPIPPTSLGYPGKGYRKQLIDGMIFERDIAVMMSDGVTIYVDLYRPQEADAPMPVLIAWSPYGKHGGVTVEMLPGSDIDPANISGHYHFEAADPLYWTRHGYGVIFVDPRGTWGSQGQHSLFSDAEAWDYYELIEWTASQAWSNSKVGLIGQSYFAIMQWKVAALRPPHLACIAPWGAASDFISDIANHGGIPETVFFRRFYELTGYAEQGMVEDVGAGVIAHPFRDHYWADKTQQLEDIEVPAYVIADWSDQGIHTRGTIEGWKRIGSRQKWLDINGRKKWEVFVQPEYADRLRMFYDYFLKGIECGVDQWPLVRIEVRDGYKTGRTYSENEWPLARTEYRRLHLHANGSVGTEPSSPGQITYDPLTDEVHFDFAIDAPTEVTGHMKLRLWVEAEGADDMDLFAAVRRLDRNGRTVNFPFDTIHDNGEVALGWLRVSHRYQDPIRSTYYQPYLTHDRELRLSPGEIVPVDIEIRPSSTQFQSGDTLRIVLKGRDIAVNDFEAFGVVGHTVLRNIGQHIIHFGGDYDSHLLLPVIPPRCVEAEGEMLTETGGKLERTNI